MDVRIYPCHWSHCCRFSWYLLVKRFLVCQPTGTLVHGIHQFNVSLLWRHNGHDGVSNHQPHDCLLIRLFRRRSKKTSKLRVTGLCAGNSPGTGEFPAQMASNAENVSIGWRHHDEMCLHFIIHTMISRTSTGCKMPQAISLWSRVAQLQQLVPVLDGSRQRFAVPRIFINPTCALLN